MAIISVFLDASSHLYKRVCPSVRPSVRPYVHMSVRMSITIKEKTPKSPEIIKLYIDTVKYGSNEHAFNENSSVKK